ncbi:MAG: hypothetical protein HYU99_00325, partial [Deltaproteobacteria bacterium]|nr:hypothetical protein [Deltaproteobacteria bacterium]
MNKRHLKILFLILFTSPLVEGSVAVQFLGSTISALTDGDYDLLSTTGSLTRDDLLADDISFNDDF